MAVREVHALPPQTEERGRVLGGDGVGPQPVDHEDDDEPRAARHRSARVSSAPMDFGLFMMPLHPPHRTFADSYDRDVAQIVLADQLGFREAWVGEHLTERWENAPAPDLLLAQALALTRNVR